MRIAFTSCMFSRVFGQQPVWGHIAQQAPDHLVLLGDCLYLDIRAPMAPQLMSDNEFSQHLFALYGELIAQPDFTALVQAMTPGTVHAIWDDHDFLWDGANGAEVHPAHSEKVRQSTAFFEAFRAALAQGLAPGSFPANLQDGRFWNLAQPELSTPSLALAPDVMLHLSDGRTHRTDTWRRRESRRTMLGQAQRDRFAQAITAAPNALHLWASASTYAGYLHYPRDLAWLEGLAANQRMLMLSGDIHRNRFDGFYTGGFPLHEATSSGAAVRDAVEVGAERQNHGLLDIDTSTVTVRVFKRGVEEDRRDYDRTTWLPAD